ncbi:discoidin domain-containing protein [Streptomyces sp. NBC_00536]|uniref:discoidin domain-containing protein n=1 Tax=Streptomyces sp. NBC_00536 TaxID=2975769 RepID=UPI002E81835C|nr:discoidin domain-containing protein [Streptomyces sp. NBC_00536]WUC81748.1 discoidin domain-containing protein [Streptomyces sp. NBC_00536]
MSRMSRTSRTSPVPRPAPPRGRPARAAFFAALATTILGTAAALPVLTAAAPAAAASAAALSPLDVQGRGATVPFTEQEAEGAATNGSVIGPDRTYTTLPAEASGRSAVRLDAAGEYVEFTLTKPANAMNVRYSVPDNAAGTGITAPVELKLDGTRLKDLDFTSKYSWYYGSYPFTNQPGEKPHHFYEETRTLFGRTLPAGAKVRLTLAQTAATPWAVVDLADFEQVADPAARPAGSLSVTDFGADPNGSADSTAAFQQAVDAGAAQSKEVWIPQGTFKLTDHVVVDKVTLRGAGPWYSVLTGRHATDRGRAAGIYGKYARGGGYGGQIRPYEDNGPSRNVTLKDFAIIGEIGDRIDDDQVNAIGGAMTDSVVDDVWMQRTKVGAWMDGPMDNFHIRNSRILDQSADGVNFHWGVTNSSVENTFLRNTGDDGLAMWADTKANVGNSFSHNTVVAPVLANNIAVYGGKDISVTDNVAAETLTNGGGLHVGNRYPGVTAGQGTDVQGTFTLARNTLIRTGNTDYGWNFPIGAVWFDSRNSSIDKATINVTDSDILDSSYAAVHFVSGTTKGVRLDNVNIDGTGTFALQFNDPAELSMTNVRATRIGFGEPVYSCLGAQLKLTQGTGNSGWNGKLPNTYCGPFPPANQQPGPDPTPTPTAPTPTPTATPTQTPTPTSTPTPTPTPTPDPTRNLLRGRPVTETSHTQVYDAAKAVDGDPGSYWESANNAFPQSLTADLGAAAHVERVVLKLPPPAAWGARTQTLAVLGSADGTAFTTLVAARDYRFDPATGNQVTIALPAGADPRHLRVTVTGNTGWPAGQIGEFEAYAG